MEMPDWLQRVEDELKEVDERLVKLRTFLGVARPRGISAAALMLLERQLKAMDEYRDILFLRISLARAELGMPCKEFPLTSAD